jgi:hypothetical protein
VRVLLCVLLPLLLQLAFAVPFAIASPGGVGVGFGVMLVGPFLIAITTAVNWLGASRQPPMWWAALALRTILVTLAFPVACGVFALVAS